MSGIAAILLMYLNEEVRDKCYSVHVCVSSVQIAVQRSASKKMD